LESRLFASKTGESMKRSDCIEAMERTLSAYSDAHIHRYFEDVKQNGLTEHGFPRLTADIGILIAHGRRRDLLPVFLEMMEFCCKTIPHVKAANDFSVREIISCLWEVEKSGVVEREATIRWRKYLVGIEPTSCYTRYATSVTDSVRNWALFTSVSEYFRLKADLCDTTEFIELQLEQQLQWFDENGMYKDKLHTENHQPIVYDLVPRGLMAMLLNQGYCGKHCKKIDGIIQKAALLTLKMQSPTGEIPFGGRSNQFLHNEAWLCVIFEFEAKRYDRMGDQKMAARFKAAAEQAFGAIRIWLEKEPIRHIKNRYPTETKYGCEGYAYFDKYMITVASILHGAYLICDDEIACDYTETFEPAAFATSAHFHKLFLKSGGYGIELDLDADTHYDANGLGRIHRAGAPSVICLSCPCPKEPSYVVDVDAPQAFSACAVIRDQGEWKLAAEDDVKMQLLKLEEQDEQACTEILTIFPDGKRISEQYTVNSAGVSVVLRGAGEIGFALTALAFDGEKQTEIVLEKQNLIVFYEGWMCRYKTDGEIINLKKVAANRNGHYGMYLAAGKAELRVNICIEKCNGRMQGV